MCSTENKGSIDERIRQITETTAKKVGYSPLGELTTCVYVPSLVKDTHGLTTLIHEEIHRDLTKGSELGFFELFIGGLITFVDAPQSEVDKTREILQLTAESSWVAHESAAVYSSAIQVFGDSPDKFLEYTDHLPHDYKVACYKYCNVIGWPTEGMDKVRILTSSHVAGFISTAALNIPILRRFKSYAEVSRASVTDFLRQHNPDDRQEKILMQLRDKKTLSHLLEIAESFSKQMLRISEPSDQGQKVTLDTLKESVAITSRLAEALGDELQRSMPQMVLWVPLDQHIRQAQEVFDRWRREWVSRGYKNAEAYKITFCTGTDDDLRTNVDLFLQQSIVQIPTGTMLFYQREFAYLPAQRLREHVEAVRAIDGDLLVSVNYNVGETAIELDWGVKWEAKSPAFSTCPWQWHGHDRVKSIFEEVKDNVRAGPHWFSCSSEDAQGIIDALASLNTVWVRWLEEEEEMIRAGEKLPNFPGLSFICAARCTIKRVIETCQQLARKVRLTVFFWTPSREAAEAQSAYVVAALPDKATSYVFPVIHGMTGLIEEALKDTRNITLLKKSGKVKAPPNFDILTDIGMFFFTG